ncbi:MAG: hypothetical protein ABSB35_21010 [Bryobacteraceae bacterium]|jgi:hypothetical protein
MLALKPQVRYSLRAAALLIAMLAVWWLALRAPMLFLLRVSESVVLRLLEFEFHGVYRGRPVGRLEFPRSG